MSDTERIRQLAAEGKITEDEAGRLIAALEDIEELDEAAHAETHAEAHAETPTPHPAPPLPPTAPSPPRLEAEASAPQAEQAESYAPHGLRWVRVRIMAGDLDIRADPGVSEPVIEKGGDFFEVRRDGQDFTVASLRRDKHTRRGEGLDGLLEGIGDFVSGVMGSVGQDLDLRVPAGYGVALDSKSGDVDISGVPFVTGNLLAGDVDLREVGGVDLVMKAGDVDASLRLLSGRHRIRVSAGDVDVRLLEGSSVTLEGGVSMGEADAGEPFVARRRGMGSSFSGQLGDGAARLELWASAGDLDVRRG